MNDIEYVCIYPPPSHKATPGDSDRKCQPRFTLTGALVPNKSPFTLSHPWQPLLCVCLTMMFIIVIVQTEGHNKFMPDI